VHPKPCLRQGPNAYCASVDINKGAALGNDRDVIPAYCFSRGFP
jgi:hypothetical protein